MAYRHGVQDANHAMMSDPSTASSRIYVGSLPINDNSFTKIELAEMFSKYGKVVGTSLNRGFGFVQFDSDNSAVDAIKQEHGTIFHGKKIDVKAARVPKEKGGAPGGRPDNHRDRGDNNIRDRSPVEREWRGRDSYPGERGSLDRDRGSMDRGDRERGDRDRGERDRGDRDRGDRDRSDRDRGPDRGHMDRGPTDRGMDRGPMDRGMDRGPLDRGMDRGPMDRGMDRGPMDRGMDRGPMERGVDRGPMDRGPMDRGPMDRGPMDRGPMDRGPMDRGPMDRGPMDRGPMDRGPMDRGPMDRGPMDRGPMDRGPMDRGPMDRDPMERGPLDRGGFYGGGAADSYRGPTPSYRPGLSELPRAGPAGVFSAPSVNCADRTNDLEIIVYNQDNREYAEYIERRLKQLGLGVDLLFPNESVPIGRVLANISSRGTLYAIVVAAQNEERRSLTLNILHGKSQEHRNMPLEDAVKMISRDFEAYVRGEKTAVGASPGVPLPVAIVPAGIAGVLGGGSERHPEAIRILLNLLVDDRQLTVLQYDKVIRYLEVKRSIQLKIEVGDTKDVLVPPASTKQEVDLQHRILNILNSSATPAPAPKPATPPVWSPMEQGAHNPLLSDPTVQKALDSLLQGGNLLKNFTGVQGFSGRF